MEAIDHREIDATPTGRVVHEQTALAILDGENGPAPLVLERAAELAVEKARESAVGMVRVVGAGPVRSRRPWPPGSPSGRWPAGCSARTAAGAWPCRREGACRWSSIPGCRPPGGGWPARPAAGGRSAPKSATAGRDGPPPASSLLEGFWLGTEVLVPAGGWLVAAVAVPALESFSTFDERLAAVAGGMTPAPGRLLPEAWEARAARSQKGVAVEATAWKALAHRARRLSVDLPDPWPTDRPRPTARHRRLDLRSSLDRMNPHHGPPSRRLAAHAGSSRSSPTS